MRMVRRKLTIILISFNLGKYIIIILYTLHSQNVTNLSISTICFLQHNLHEHMFYINTIHWFNQ
jgi:hypothetical protein